ncbi:hypothetical protein BH09PLA1_BH09PLA1_04430 [soil metagenome]
MKVLASLLTNVMLTYGKLRNRRNGGGNQNGRNRRVVHNRFLHGIYREDDTRQAQIS